MSAVRDRYMQLASDTLHLSMQFHRKAFPGSLNDNAIGKERQAITSDNRKR